MKKLFTLIIFCVLITSFSVIGLPRLSSFPSAQATIFLDFDGHNVASTSWNNGNALNCAPATLSDLQITEIFNRVSEDYRPFNINITTDSAIFLSAPLDARVRVIITPTSSWYAGVGGVAYTGSFTWGDDTPAFVFCDKLGPNNSKMIAECCTHESGHTVGLSHQSTYDNNCTLTAVYSLGSGTGETGWAPVMGNSYYKNLSGWSNGPTPYGCASSQDNLSKITSNGVGYRTDDHSDSPDNNPTLINVVNQIFSASGIITTTIDKDVFKLNILQTDVIHINVLPFSVGANDEGANIDLKVTLLNAAKQIIKIYDLPSVLKVTIDTTLVSGTYYFVVDGTGNANSTEYGSLGSYSINGMLTPLGTTPVSSVMLSGNADRNTHNLNWNIISDEKIKKVDIESSSDGRSFMMLSSIDPDKKNFSYNTSLNEDKFYRLKIISITGQVMYSNVLALKASLHPEKLFTISTLVHDEIIINAGENYHYNLTDMSGRVIQKGNNTAGINRININNNPNGIYILKIISNNQRQTERILKQ